MTQYNLAYSLFELANSQPDKLALAIPKKFGKPLPKNRPLNYHKISFRELGNETNRISTGLLASGFQPGERVVLMVPPRLEFFVLNFAFLQSGIIPVLIDPGIGIKNLKRCIDESKPSGFIGISKAHIARVLLNWAGPTIKKNITVGPGLFRAGKLLKNIRDRGRSIGPAACFEAKSDDLAAILFTSGSTGVPKGVMYSHGNFQQQVKIIRNTFNTRPGEIDMPTFLPFALFNVAAGMTTIIPDMDPTRPANVDPERIIRAVNQFEVTSMFGSPALIDRLGRYGEAKNIKLPNLKRVFSAGAPVPIKTLMRLTTMLNSTTEIFTPYGATEAMPVSYISSHYLLQDRMRQRTANGAGICIGKPVNDLEVQVIGITDEPIEFWSDELKIGNGEVGEIVVKGKNVTRSYFNRDVETKLAKIVDGDSFWHRMGDLGYRDTDGNFWFCGRKTHRVILANKVLYSVQCESIFNQHPQVYRTALVAVNNEAVLCVEIDKDVLNPDREKISKELLQWAAENELTKDIRTILYHPSFPVDVRHNAKIFREKLAVWAKAKLLGR